MITFGLTGGICSGKSSVARLFSGFGIPVIDADQVARQVVQPGGAALLGIVSAFGPAILLSDGTLNRAALGKLVFSDPDKLAQLNILVHPEVKRRVNESVALLTEQGHPLACYDVPLLFETGQQDQYRPVVVVTADDELRLARLMLRDGLSRADAEARLSSQLPLAQKVAQADVVLQNNGDLVQLARSARVALDHVRQLVG